MGGSPMNDYERYPSFTLDSSWKPPGYTAIEMMEAERTAERKRTTEGSRWRVDDFPRSMMTAYILSFTSPRDVCRSALVSRIFRSASESDAVWDNFLPSAYDWRFIRSRADPKDLNLYDALSSKKNLFFKLCEAPLLIDEGTKSFQLDKDSGKKCIMLGARDLVIVWGSTPMCWTWEHLPDARFSEVAELIQVGWFEIRATINPAFLSKDTKYGAYFVFKIKNKYAYYGFDADPVEVKIEINECENQSRSVCLEIDRWMVEHDHRMGSLPGPSRRDDGWWEIGLGEFDIVDENDVLEISMTETTGLGPKGGLIVHGIEIRPEA